MKAIPYEKINDNMSNVITVDIQLDDEESNCLPGDDDEAKASLCYKLEGITTSKPPSLMKNHSVIESISC